MIVIDLIHQLEQLGAHIIGPASSNEQALRLIAETASLGGAVLDLKVSGEMSVPVADALSEKGIRFVFATGTNANEVPKKFAHVPFYGKPVSILEIAQALSV